MCNPLSSLLPRALHGSYLFPYHALIFCCLESWRCQCSFAFGSVLSDLSERGWQLASPRHASCSVKSEWVNSNYFSGKWERFLCNWGGLPVPESTIRLQIVSGKQHAAIYNTYSFLRCMGICVCNWECQHTYL